MVRDILARRALSEIPRILTLQDRVPVSPTYGCFDRNYWHYRIIDFPSGMAQEFALPLALAHGLDIPDSPYHGQQQIARWAEAGIAYAARAAHPDGSCDDYYPYERASGAAAFSLFAALESYRLLALDRPDFLAFFRRRGRWLTAHRESGHLSNHEALIACSAVLLADITGDRAWDAAARERLERLLSWQNPEGWFREYEGCDPGYLTLTISMLARIDRARPDWGLKPVIERTIDFIAPLVHPDGSFGGELGSRNTLNFFPDGFEIAGSWMPKARAINDAVVPALEDGPSISDDHILGHHCWSYLAAWREWSEVRGPRLPRPEVRVSYPEAGLLVQPLVNAVLYVATKKGGSFKLFREGAAPHSDTGVTLVVSAGRKRKVAVAHMQEDSTPHLEDGCLVIEGNMHWAPQARMSPVKLVVLRLIMLTVGRAQPNLVRRLLQGLLITGRNPAPFRFRRRFEWRDGALLVRDEIGPGPWDRVVEAGIGGHQTSIAVVMARVYHPHQLQPWHDLTSRLEEVEDGEPLVIERRWAL